MAEGELTFAGGYRATSVHDGSFVWADRTGAAFSSTYPDQFSVRASGGTRIYSNGSLTAGVTLTPGGSSWSSVSDSTLKRNIKPVDGETLLRKLGNLRISQWSYKSQDESIEHIGPMAQDFHALFGLGEDDRHINSIDADGVALAAAKSLYQRILIMERENSELRDLVSKIQDQLSALHDRQSSIQHSACGP